MNAAKMLKTSALDCWIAQARQILGRYIVDDQGEAEEWLHDLYCDGCEPSEAVTEVRCQLGLIEA
ncbi:MULTISPECIES: hypothetical protein [Pseudomonas]|uniref:hypothetical protein n=1 Tax=Pseudomonas TaxID=286 RepID=UPI0022488C74|nr:hypothetical protein [Pseudomonas sp. DCB_BG]MCX2706087.1 hypothetical protein [Pseudomonas sp. DCB_BG]